jgi:hypothetical protein
MTNKVLPDTSPEARYLDSIEGNPAAFSRLVKAIEKTMERIS